MSEKIVLLDGAVGTSLWEKTENKVPVWRYNIENPAIVTELNSEYAEAGAQIILANTFGANGGAVAHSPYTVDQVVTAGVRLAKQAVGGRAKIALAVGPLTGLLEPYGDITADQARALFEEQMSAGMKESPDLICIQTFIDLEMMKIAARVAGGFGVPVFCTMSFEPVGKTMMGNSVQDMVEGLKDCRVDAIGLNCSLGPDTAVPIIRTFRQCTDLPLIFKPNAGKPTFVDGQPRMSFDIETFVKDSLPALDCGVSCMGGCCGTNAAYIRRLGQRLRELGRL